MKEKESLVINRKKKEKSLVKFQGLGWDYLVDIFILKKYDKIHQKKF